MEGNIVEFKEGLNKMKSKKSKYKYTDNCREISGFGGEYEEACRTMVIAGMEWLDKHKDAKPTCEQFENIIGVTVNQNKAMEEMQDCMIQAIGGDATGAMVQYATNHVLHARKNGWDKYIQEMEDEQTKKPEEEIKIGTRFFRRSLESKGAETVIDIHRTYNVAGDLVKTTYVTESLVYGQPVKNYDVEASIILQSEIL